MNEDGWKPRNWEEGELAGIPPGSYDVEFVDSNDKAILVHGTTIMSMVTTEFDSWIKSTNREAYKSTFIQIF